VDSSNYNPLPAWTAGCQVVALNYQTPSIEMQLNRGLFQLNGATGYVLKPTILTEPSTSFSPNGPFNDSDGVLLTIRILCGYQLSRQLATNKADDAANSKDKDEDKSISPFVKLSIFGVDSDIQSYKTDVVKDSGYHAEWNNEYKIFVHAPQVAHIHLAVKDYNVASTLGGRVKTLNRVQDLAKGKGLAGSIAYKGDRALLGYFSAPLTALKQGYRHVKLKDRHSRPLLNSSLLIHMTSCAKSETTKEVLAQAVRRKSNQSEEFSAEREALAESL